MADFYYESDALTGLQEIAGDLLVLYIKNAVAQVTPRDLAICWDGLADEEIEAVANLIDNAEVECIVGWDESE